MTKINKSIEIVRSEIRGLSSLSKVSASGILNALENRYESVRITILNDLSDLDELRDRKPDLVFLGIHFLLKEPGGGLNESNKVWVSRFLEDNGISHTGSDSLAHNLTVNKDQAKAQVISSGLSTSKYYIANTADNSDVGQDILEYPLFVKPTNRGGGVGIDTKSVAYNSTELNNKIVSLSTEYNCDSLVEEYLTGREFSVAILRDYETDDYIAMPIELVAPIDQNGHRILTGKVKTADSERHYAISDEILKESVSSLALAVFHSLGARDYGRIDIRLNGSGTPNFLEANLIPSLTNGFGNFPKACMLNIGLGYEGIISKIIELGFKRSFIFEEEIIDRNVLPGTLLVNI